MDDDLNRPLTELVRPSSLHQYIGQNHLTNHRNGAITNFIRLGYLPSMILHGPPGVGKTTLASIIAKEAGYVMVELSATDATVSTIRRLLNEIRDENRKRTKLGTPHLRVCVFIDEIHRFSKVQQDFLLPFVEEGLFVFLGATTFNPATRLRPAIRSRCQLFKLNELTKDEVKSVLKKAALYENVRRRIVYGKQFLSFSSEVLNHIINTCKGDARSAVNMIEMVSINLSSDAHKYTGTYDPIVVTSELVDTFLKELHRQNGGLNHVENNGLLVHFFSTINECKPKPKKRKTIVDDSKIRRTFRERMDYSDDEYQDAERSFDGSDLITKTEYLKVKAIKILLQLLHRGESPLFIAKQLVIFTVLYTDCDYSILRQTLSIVKAFEVSDVIHVLSDCVERLVECPKRDTSKKDPFLSFKSTLQFLKKSTRFNSSFQPQAEQFFPVEYDSELVDSLLQPPQISSGDENQVFPVTNADELGDMYSVGTPITNTNIFENEDK